MKLRHLLRPALALSWCAGLLAPTAHAAIPSKAEDWYTPESYKYERASAVWIQKGTEYGVSISINQNGEELYTWINEPNDKGLKNALETALFAKLSSLQNHEEIETIGKNLQSVLGASEITMNKTDPNGGTHTVKYQVANGSILNSLSQNGGIQLTDPSSSHNIADNITLQWNLNNTMSLRNWQTNPSSTLVLANVGGILSYLPYIMEDCSCTQKWETVAKWVGSTAQNEATTLTLPKSSLADYLKKEHGMVFFQNKSNTSGFIYNAYFEQENDNDNTIYANFLAPYNWVDDKTLTTSNGVYSLKVSPDCDISLTQALTDPSSVTTHSFLALEESGDLHYVPIGKGITGGVQPDGVSIVSNETGLAIAGYANASTDTVLTRSAEGVEWKKAAAEADGTTITTTDDNKLTLTGFAAAANGSQAVKGADGAFAWSELVSITNTYTLLAGAGINITKNNDSGVVTISAQSLTTSAEPSTLNLDFNFAQVSFVTDVQYDTSTHQLQIKKATALVPVKNLTETDWLTVFTAVSHKSEHESEATE